ncbi:sensor histidine kinase [Luteimicrobium subarcticum]|uniref:sensor histidine kinase n=1 Tax=Luteimicrobium subarcticum TaxID=620910 RepID=UPI0012FD7F6E|nr:histidine kinase [Luteimicrobium subarcticum]
MSAPGPRQDVPPVPTDTSPVGRRVPPPAAAPPDERLTPEQVAARRTRAWKIIGPLFGIVWVVFLSEPLAAAWGDDDPVLRWAGVVGVLLTAAGFAASVYLFRTGDPRRAPMVGVLGVEVVGVVLACLGAQQHGLIGLVFVSVTVVYITRSARVLVVTVALAVVCAVLPRVVRGWEPEDGTIAALFLATLATFGFSQLVQRNRQLQLAQEEVATLAVSRERERIARDMHDVLGHSLTVISVKSELAARLVTVDPARAAAELADIQGLARSALADVRGMVTATRHLTLAGELAAARRALDAGGIDARLPGAVDAVPEDLRELFAWTVREGTTNVLRHAAARTVVVTLAPDRVVVEDDGRGAPPCPGAGDPVGGATDDVHGSAVLGDELPGHGLAGLRERAEAVGARLETGPGSLGGFRLAVVAPGARIAR